MDNQQEQVLDSSREQKQYTMESSKHPFGARDAKRIIEQYLI